MTRSHNQKTAASGVDKAALELLALPVQAKSNESGASQASLSSISEVHVVEKTFIGTTPSLRSKCINPVVMEATRRKSERLLAEKLVAIADTQEMFKNSPVVAATTVNSATVNAKMSDQVYALAINPVEQVSTPEKISGDYLALKAASFRKLQNVRLKNSIG